MVIMTRFAKAASALEERILFACKFLLKKKWSSLHGFSGLTILIVGLMEFSHFLMYRHVNHNLAMVKSLASAGLVIGLGTNKSLSDRLKTHIQRERHVFTRGALWALAFGMQGISIYTLSWKDWEQGNEFGFSYFDLFATLLFVAATLASLTVALGELAYDKIWNSGFVIANMASQIVLLAMPLLHLRLGTTEMVDLYARIPALGATVSMVGATSSFSNAIDLFFLGFVSSGRADIKVYKIQTVCNWVIFYPLMTAHFVAILYGTRMGIYSWLGMGALYFCCATIEKKFLPHVKYHNALC